MADYGEHRLFKNDTVFYGQKVCIKLITEHFNYGEELSIDIKVFINGVCKALLENEVLHKSDVERLIGPRPWTEEAKEEPAEEQPSEELETDVADN